MKMDSPKRVLIKVFSLAALKINKQTKSNDKHVLVGNSKSHLVQS